MGWDPVGNTLSTDRRGYEDWNKLDASLRAALLDGRELGGSKSVAVSGTGWLEAEGARPFRIPVAASAGGTYSVIVDRRCEHADTTITWRLRNITDDDGTGDVTGTAYAGTTWAAETKPFTPIVDKTYVLQFTKSDDLHACFGIGGLARSES